MCPCCTQMVSMVPSPREPERRERDAFVTHRTFGGCECPASGKTINLDKENDKC